MPQPLHWHILETHTDWTVYIIVSPYDRAIIRTNLVDYRVQAFSYYNKYLLQ